MLIALLCIPFFGAVCSWFISYHPIRRIFLVVVAFAEFLLALSTWFFDPAPVGTILHLDVMGRLVLTVTCTLFFAAAGYGAAYLHAEDSSIRRDIIHGFKFTNAPEATFTGCLFLFLASAVLVACTQHFGFLWVGIETTTLVSAPLIYFHRHRRSLEATWKYLMICSVGIALALVGNLLLDISMQTGGVRAVSMTLPHLQEIASNAHQGWFRAAFVFLFIGYGTKMGITPMHTWLPDAHSEAPSLVSALLSGALLNCAFLGIFRAHQVSIAIGLQDFSSAILVAFGLLSLLVAALFIVGQTDFKRMLAYSSVEHMGILLLALGLTGGIFAHAKNIEIGLTVGKAFGLHLICHSLVKASLFMLAGNILAKYHTKTFSEISNLGNKLPITGILWMLGILAIVGSPPFGLFVSEISILQSMLIQGYWVYAVVYLALLGVIFVGMITPVIKMYSDGDTTNISAETPRRNILFLLPPAILLSFALCLGLFMPEWLENTLLDITSLLAPHEPPLLQQTFP